MSNNIIRIEFDDLTVHGFDPGGVEEVMYYQGKPFTGYAVEYMSDGKLYTENEYINGIREGVTREYWIGSNQIRIEYFVIGGG